MITISEKKLRALMNRCFAEGFKLSTYEWNGENYKRNPERDSEFRFHRDQRLAKVKLA